MATTLAWLRSRSNAQLAGAAVALSALWLVSLVFVFGTPEPLRVALTVLGSVAAPALATLVGVRLAAPRLGLATLSRNSLLAVTVFAFVALALAANSFSVGFDDADAGRPSGLFANLTAVFAVATVVAFATAIALVVVAAIGPRLAPRARWAIAATVGLLAAPLVAVTFLTPAPHVVFSVAVAVWALVAAGFAARPAEVRPRAAVTDRPLVAIEGVRDRVILLAAASLAITLIVWACGITWSISSTGTDAATTGLGVASALGQLAVIPLLWASSLLLGVWLPATAATARFATIVASAIVAATAVTMVAGYSPEGDRFVLLVGVLSVGVGFWAATVVWALCSAFAKPARVATSVIALIAGAAVYALFVALNGGVTLALASGFLAFGGARLLLRQRRSVPAGD